MKELGTKGKCLPRDRVEKNWLILNMDNAYEIAQRISESYDKKMDMEIKESNLILTDIVEKEKLVIPFGIIIIFDEFGFPDYFDSWKQFEKEYVVTQYHE